MDRRVKTVLTLSLAGLLLAAQSQFPTAHAARADDGSGAVLQGKSEAMKMKQTFVPGRLLVKYRPNVSSRLGNELMMATGAREDRELAGLRVKVIDLPAETDEESYAEALRSRPEIEFVEPDYICYPVNDMVPDDPLYASQWHLRAVSCPAAWGMTSGSDQVTIAMCDTGVDSTHPDLASKLLPGWNVVDNNTDTSPVYAHGTWTSGTAAATGNNGIGVAAPALDCRILPIRVSDSSNGSALLSDLAAGVVWAADHGARVVNVSYEGATSETLSDAGAYLQSKGGVLVMAAGNTGGYYAGSDSPYITVVGATDQNDGLAAFSRTGPLVDLSAPGLGILTTGLDGTYQQVSGTSFSAPIVAGAVGLMLSVNPLLTPAQVDTILKVTADDLGPSGWDPGYGWGRLNVGRAIKVIEDTLAGASDTTLPAVGFLQPQVGGPNSGVIGISSGELVQVNALDDRGVADVSLFVDDALIGSDSIAPYTFYANTSSFADGSQHVVTAVATDEAGNSRTLALTATAKAGFDVTPPRITITSPREGDRVNANIRVTMNATDNQGYIERVELFVDGLFVDRSYSAPFTMRFSGKGLSTGRHTLVCTASDLMGNSTSASITVTAR